MGRSFPNVPPTNPFYAAFETLLHWGAFTCLAADIQAVEPVGRAEVAEVVLKAMEGAGYAPPACTGTRFKDVAETAPECAWIHELARREIVAGCGDGNYCGDRSVSRAELAVILGRALGGSPPACSSRGRFLDVDAGSPYCRWIEDASRRGFTAGCGKGRFCPTHGVSRGELAAFVVEAFGLDAPGRGIQK